MIFKNDSYYRTRIVVAVFALFYASVSSHAQTDISDPHSFSRPAEVSVKHLDLNLTVNFEQKRLSGSARLAIENHTGSDKLHLDTRTLDISRVALDHGQAANYVRGESVEHLGQPLIIDIRPETEAVTVEYSTSQDAAAVQWLAPRQTAGGKHPFLFTQSQAILARTWIPCQDTPGVRMTYSATIATEPELLAVMSAENPTRKSADGVYHFEMPQPIPSYLMALAIGDLEFRAIGERSGVYAEPTVVEKAAWEFADTERMMVAAEELYGPYRWGRYHIIVLPPSFPFGGMENPRLTFATPTVLAGDRSLVSLIAHELAHSWSGNLVTNANWDDFWLNEGFTTYFEHRIMEKLYGKKHERMLAALEYQELLKDVKKMPPRDTHLHLALKGRDPDEGMTAIAYDKGHFFLRTMEHIIGRAKWDAFLRTYFDQFAFQPMTSERFVDYFRKELVKGDKDLENKLQIDAWVYGPGIPDNVVEVHSDEFAKVEKQIDAWQNGTRASELQTEAWTTHHWLHFLNQLPQPLTQSQMAELDRAFGFSDTGNSEILHDWLLHVIANQYEPGYAALEAFLTGQGRRKFLRPLYTEMAKTPKGRKMAKRIYGKARPTYHTISRQTIDEILDWRES